MAVVFEKVTHVFMPGSPFMTTAIQDISLTIEDGEFVGLIGHTGSGKSTLIQHINGLLKPTSGRVEVGGIDTARKGADMVRLRRMVGLVFQYPEHQLFEETVADDVAFGPRNLGLGEDEVKERVREALEAVGFRGDDAAAIGRRSPFGLSGGQMRRVAVAGVLAMRPGTLVLDEPTAGLDPRGRQGLLDTLLRLHRERGLTLVVVSHNMEDLARLVDRVIVLDRGRVVLKGPTRQVFGDPDRLRELGLDAPPVVTLLRDLARRGAVVRTDLLEPAEAAAEIDRWLRSGAPRGAAADTARGGDGGRVDVR